jgi:hypothetical protein
VSTPRRRWPRHLDHYYWLTAYLAARDMQTRTCRLVATIILGLGAIPSTLMMSSVGPDGLQNRLLAGVITVCCVVMGALWLRHCWPTRTQSQLCVVVGTVCIAVASLIEDHPVIGLLGSTAFAVLSAFTAFFHSPRLLAFTWTVGVVTLGGELAHIIDKRDPDELPVIVSNLFPSALQSRKARAGRVTHWTEATLIRVSGIIAAISGIAALVLWLWSHFFH